MNFPISLRVANGPVRVGCISMIGVATSSAFLIGDTESFALYSYFDTPPESVIVGQLAPMPAPPEEE